MFFLVFIIYHYSYDRVISTNERKQTSRVSWHTSAQKMAQNRWCNNYISQPRHWYTLTEVGECVQKQCITKMPTRTLGFVEGYALFASYTVKERKGGEQRGKTCAEPEGVVVREFCL